MDSEPKEFYIKRGKSYYTMGLYFVQQNNDLSIAHFIINKFLSFNSLLIKAIFYHDIKHFFFAIGLAKLFITNIQILIGLKSNDTIKNQLLDSTD